MNSIDETSLINLVRKYPLLYDLTSSLYNDQQKKEDAWNEISILMGASAYDCKTKWTRLRDNYRKALIVRNKNSNQGKDRAVKYEKLLSFLNEKFAFASRKRNVLSVESAPCEDQDIEEPPAKVLSTESTTYTPGPIKFPKKSVIKPVPSINARPVHEINAFFEGIAETVKTFPRKIQVQLKREIFNLVNETEASLVDNENANITYYTMDSSLPGVSDYVSNRLTESPSGTSGSNEYTASPVNRQQMNDSMMEHQCEVKVIKEELNI